MEENFEQYWSVGGYINNKRVGPTSLLFKIYFK